MIKDIFPDSETSIVSESFAIIYSPRKNRKRFPKNCVTIVQTHEQAIAETNLLKNQHPAKVLGPSRSSEGLMLYYLVEWLNSES